MGQAWDSSDESPKAPAKQYSYTSTYNGGEAEFHILLCGEGITILGDKIYQLTWRSGMGLIFDRKSLKYLGSYASNNMWEYIACAAGSGTGDSAEESPAHSPPAKAQRAAYADDDLAQELPSTPARCSRQRSAVSLSEHSRAPNGF